MVTLRSLLVLFAAAAVLHPERPSAAEARGPTIAVHVVLVARVPDEVVEQAKADASRIYLTLGIELIWVTEPAIGGFTVRIVAKEITEAGRAALGVAPRDRRQTGRLLFVFYGRIVNFARQHDKSVALILGHVIAHELGHLLLPHGSHSRTGIMKAKWDRRQVEQIGQGVLSFTSKEGEQIRMRVVSLHATPKADVVFDR